MIDDIADQLAGNLAAALVASLETHLVGEPEVRERRLSEVSSLMIRSSSAIAVAKCIYPKLPIPAHGDYARLRAPQTSTHTALF